MKELLDKISSYNIFNNLLSGVLFVFIAKHITIYNFVQSDIVLGIALYYFVGLIISRFGSLVVEKTLEKIKFIQYSKYEDYIVAHQKDTKIDVLLESNNMYRTLCSMGILLLILKLYEFLSIKFCFYDSVAQIILIALLVILFLFSFRKQTNYIKKRVNKALQ